VKSEMKSHFSAGTTPEVSEVGDEITFRSIYINMDYEN
jgi:hypothetical protein